jgi:hypothetical protein
MGQVRHGSATIEQARRHRFEPDRESRSSGHQYIDTSAGKRLLANAEKRELCSRS